MNLYEGMFLLDNQVVRADWPKAKALVSDAIAKHGGEVETARRWDERKLCYPIDGKKRSTYVLAYYRIGIDGITGLRRDLELSEDVLRYMMLRVEEIPAGEADKAGEENVEGFSFPAPPEDDEPEEVPAPKAEEPKAKDAKAEDAKAEDAKAEEGEASKEESTQAKTKDTDKTEGDAEAKSSDEGSSDTPNEKVEA